MDKTILVVEDEKAISDILVFNLEREGYKAISACDGEEGLKFAFSQSPDLILLDVMLPVMDGFDVCKKVREKSDVPIIMLTAREEETDKIMGLEIGADDYITKPFSMRELLARIKANMRRSPVISQSIDEQMMDKGISISEDRGEIYKNGEIVDLTFREFEIMKFLMSRPENIISREQLMEKVWGYDYYGDLRAVDVAIRRLREKVEDDPAIPCYIITKRGMGYYFSQSK